MSVQQAQYFRGEGIPDLPASTVGFQEVVPRPAGSAKIIFFTETLEITAPNGQKLYRPVERLRKIIPGDLRNEVVRKVTDRDREVYAAEYAAFKRGQTPATTGMPLEYWGGLNESQIKTLKYHNVMSVEDLAAVSHTQAQSIGMGIMTLVRSAQAWLDNKKDGGATARALSELTETLKQALAFKDKQIAEMGHAIEGLQQQLQYRNAAVVAGLQAAPTGHIAPFVPAPVVPTEMEGAFGTVDVSGEPVEADVSRAPVEREFAASKRGPGRPRKEV